MKGRPIEDQTQHCRGYRGSLRRSAPNIARPPESTHVRTMKSSLASIMTIRRATHISLLPAACAPW